MVVSIHLSASGRNRPQSWAPSRAVGTHRHGLDDDAPVADRTRATLVSVASGMSGYRAGPDVLVHECNCLADPVGSACLRTAEIDAARAAFDCGALRDLTTSTEARSTSAASGTI